MKYFSVIEYVKMKNNARNVFGTMNLYPMNMAQKFGEAQKVFFAVHKFYEQTTKKHNDRFRDPERDCSRRCIQFDF